MEAGSRGQRDKVMGEVRGQSPPTPRVLLVWPHENCSMGIDGRSGEGGKLAVLPAPPSLLALALGSCHLRPENPPQTRRCLKIDPSWGEEGEGEH